VGTHEMKSKRMECEGACKNYVGEESCI